MVDRDIGQLPEGWYVLWQESTHESIMWTTEIQQQYKFPNEWFEMLDWAKSQIQGV